MTTQECFTCDNCQTDRPIENITVLTTRGIECNICDEFSKWLDEENVVVLNTNKDR